MTALSLIGIIIALAFIFYGSMKSISPIILAPIAAIIVALTSGLDVSASYATTYMSGVGGFVTANFPVFLTSAIFGKFLESSGLCTSISRAVVQKFGAKSAILAMSIASVLLSIAGISAFVIIFTLYPMSLAMFREADVPRPMIPAALVGPTIAASILPGLPQLYNSMASQGLGVSASAGLVMGLIMAVVAFVLCVLYLNWTYKRLQAKGLHFEMVDSDKKFFENEAKQEKLPNPWLTLIPVVIAVVLLNIVKLTAAESLAIASVITLFMFFKPITADFRGILQSAVGNSFAIIVTAAIVGFGNVVKATAGYESIAEGLGKLSMGNPYLLAFISVNVIAAVTGSGSGGLTVALNTVSAECLAMGANVNALMRIFVVSCLCFDTMPHNSVVVTSLNACQVKHSDGYKYLFATNAIIPTICAILGMILAAIGIV